MKSSRKYQSYPHTQFSPIFHPLESNKAIEKQNGHGRRNNRHMSCCHILQYKLKSEGKGFKYRINCRGEGDNIGD